MVIYDAPSSFSPSHFVGAVRHSFAYAWRRDPYEIAPAALLLYYLDHPEQSASTDPRRYDNHLSDPNY